MTQGSVDVAGVSWAYEVVGDGPLLVLFHGTLSSRTTFSRQVGSLSRHARVVTIDWPGHGASGFDPDGWTVSQLTDAVPRLIDALGERTAVLGGVSQGGAIAMRAALRSPGRVDGLITMSAGPDRPGDAAIESMARLGQVLAHGTDDERRTAVAGLQRAFFHADGWVEAHPQAARAELEVMLGHPREAMPHATHIPATYDSIEAELGQIGCPTLVIWGVEDVRASWGPRMAEAIPDARLVTVPGAGHHVQLDAPQAVADAMTDFLDELSRRNTSRTEARA